jgi:hypothetical protein
MRNTPQWFSREGNVQFHLTRLEAEPDEVLADLARVGDRIALETLRKRIQLRHEAGASDLHPRVLTLALELFLYGLPKAASGPKTLHYVLRNRTICAMVRVIHQDYGFPIYGNPQRRRKKNAPLSAVRIVANEIGMTERAVDQIWRQNKDRNPRN